MATAEARPDAQTKTAPDDRTRPKQPPLWNVVLLDDDHHSYEYVIGMMQQLFAHSMEKAFKVALIVDEHGRAICLTTHKEHAEFKRDQILAFGKDRYIAGCKGSMSAVIEPVESPDSGR